MAIAGPSSDMVAVAERDFSRTPPPSSLLAPGFRFHPTDEELVSYYLKRKVSNRPLRVDAISEVDLYKCEPWDLPAMSKIRSRDMEWYFFSPLDRKYANRSRTNRATTQGYWKTTGKDRLVRHNGKSVGMKKTLVFHVGRAPRGQRTNWVMHEYRLEGEDVPASSSSSSVSQDSYVVCRIFQKCGPGPQNGAQYGAPFLEEEWDEEGEYVAITESEEQLEAPALEGNNSFLEATGNQDYLQNTDVVENENNAPAKQLESTDLLVMGPLGLDQNGIGQLEPTVFLEDILGENVISDDGYVTMPEVQDVVPTAAGGWNPGVLIQSDSSTPGESDGFLELNDLADMESVCNYPSEEHTSHFLMAGSEPEGFLANGSSTITEAHEDVYFDVVNEYVEQPQSFHYPALKDALCLQPNNDWNPISSDVLLSGPANNDNLAFFDLLNQEKLDQEFVATLNNPAETDMVDELLAFFDATDDKLHYDPPSYVNKSGVVDSFFSDQLRLGQVEGGHLVSPKAAQVSHEGITMGQSSSGAPPAENRMGGSTESVTGEQEAQMNHGLDKSFTKRLVNMLGSISSPPALAAEFPGKEVKACPQNSASLSGSSFHVTAGMIHIRSLTLTNVGDRWSVQKNGSVGFLLSYGMGDDGVVGKPIGLEHKANISSGGPSVVLRGWLYVLFISVLFLAASYRIALCICSR